MVSIKNLKGPAWHMPRTPHGSGRNKSRVKKREYKEHCRVMRISGMTTDDKGQWYSGVSHLGPGGEARKKMTTQK